MSPKIDILLRRQYTDVIWELHQLATAGALSEAEYQLQKGINFRSNISTVLASHL